MNLEVYLSASPFGADGLERAAAIARQVGCEGLELSELLVGDEMTRGGIGGLPLRVLAVMWRPEGRGDLPASLTLARRLRARAVNIYGGLPAGLDAAAARQALIGDVRAAMEKTPQDSPLLLLENELAKAPGLSASFDA